MKLVIPITISRRSSFLLLHTMDQIYLPDKKGNSTDPGRLCGGSQGKGHLQDRSRCYVRYFGEYKPQLHCSILPHCLCWYTWPVCHPPGCSWENSALGLKGAPWQGRWGQLHDPDLVLYGRGPLQVNQQGICRPHSIGSEDQDILGVLDLRNQGFIKREGFLCLASCPGQIQKEEGGLPGTLATLKVAARKKEHSMGKGCKA